MRLSRTAGIIAATSLLAACGAPSATATSTAGGTSEAPASGSGLHVRTLGVHLPAAVAREAVIDLGGGKFIIAGGYIAGDQSTDRTYELDLPGGKLTAMPNLPVKTHDLAGGLWGNRPAAIGGGNSTELDVIQAWNGSKWSTVGHLPTGNSDDAAVTINGTTYVAGGYDGKGPLTSVLSLAGSKVAKVGTLPVGVRYAAPAVVDGKGYFFGGEASGVMVDAVQRFDPTTGKVDVVAHLPRAIGHGMAAVVGGRVLFIGGRFSTDASSIGMYWFDPKTNAFTDAGSLPSALTDAFAVVSPDHKNVWVIGGEKPKVTDEVLEISLG